MGIASRGASKQSGSWATQEYSGRNTGYSKTSVSSTRQDHSTSASGFRQEQSAGYARHLGSSHSGAALIRSEHTVSASSRHEASSSSAYQSTAQQSYRGQQNTLSESRVERTTPTRLPSIQGLHHRIPLQIRKTNLLWSQDVPAQG